MVLPSRYTLYPTRVLRMSHVPPHLRWTYLIFYALAWQHQYEWLDETYERLAEIISEIEGELIRPRGVRQRVSDLAGCGLIERRQIGGRYRTYLLVRHEKEEEEGDAGGVTSSGRGDVLGRHPIKNNHVAVVETEREEETDHQQQQYSNRGDVERNEELLRGMGLVGDVVKRLAREPHVTPEYLEQVMAYRAQRAAEETILKTGWVVKCVGEGWQLPEEEDDNKAARYRFIRGKYKDYVRH